MGKIDINSLDWDDYESYEKFNKPKPNKNHDEEDPYLSQRKSGRGRKGDSYITKRTKGRSRS